MFRKLSYYYSKLFKKYVRGKSIRNSQLHNSVAINSGSLVINSSIGKYSYTGYDCIIINTNIGSYCSLADNVVIGSAQHPMNWVSTSPVFENVVHSGPTKRFAKFDVPKSKITTIGSDVWIGHGVIIKAGVNIGTGAVIGAGAVVTKDVAPYAVVGGCPAKVIKYRFTQSVIEQLIESEWWELSDEELQRKSHLITDPESFLETFR